MPQTNYPNTQNNYDPRWFIWTIVFLVSTGIMLVTYIVASDNGTNDVPSFPVVKAQAHKLSGK